MLICTTFDVYQCVYRQAVQVSSLSTCGTTETIVEPSLMRFQPLKRARWCHTGSAAARASAFQGRCFDPVQRNAYSASHNTPADDGVRDQMTRGRRASAILAEGASSWNSSRRVKASSVVRARIDAANGPAWAAPRITSPDHQSRADPALVRRLEQGARESDGQEHANRGNLPHRGTWSGTAQKGLADGEGELPWSPCRSYV